MPARRWQRSSVAATSRPRTSKRGSKGPERQASASSNRAEQESAAGHGLTLPVDRILRSVRFGRVPDLDAMNSLGPLRVDLQLPLTLARTNPPVSAAPSQLPSRRTSHRLAQRNHIIGFRAKPFPQRQTEFRPRVHQRSSLVEKVGVEIGYLSFACDDVGHRHFHNFGEGNPSALRTGRGM
jgi:hypothetical protein